MSDFFFSSVTRLIKASSSSSSSLALPSKLSAAQAELQACETQLAAKEQELVRRRASALKDAFGARCNAMIECGSVWAQMGKEGVSALETLGSLVLQVRRY